MKEKNIHQTEIKKYKELIKDGLGEYLLTQGGKIGIIFSSLIFLTDSFIWEEVQGPGTYLFYAIFFGLFVGLWTWYSINKKIKEYNVTIKKT